MKKAKSILSVLLCAAILLSCAPVFNLNFSVHRLLLLRMQRSMRRSIIIPPERLLFRILLQVMERKQLMLKDP